MRYPVVVVVCLCLPFALVDGYRGHGHLAVHLGLYPESVGGNVHLVGGYDDTALSCQRKGIDTSIHAHTILGIYQYQPLSSCTIGIDGSLLHNIVAALWQVVAHGSVVAVGHHHAAHVRDGCPSRGAYVGGSSHTVTAAPPCAVTTYIHISLVVACIEFVGGILVAVPSLGTRESMSAHSRQIA